MRIGTVVILVLLFSHEVYAKTQERPVYLDEDAKIIFLGTYNKKKSYPLVVFFPFTTANAQRFFDFVKAAQPWESYIAIIPRGVTQRKHYLPDFISFIRWYEKRILKDIADAKKIYNVEVV